ncbi:MAG: GxxExxY protein [Chloroflexota bacterium]
MKHGDSETQGVGVPSELNVISGTIVDAAYKVHSALGPGLLESVYEACLTYELTKRGHVVQRQLAVPVSYDGVQIDAALRLDLLVDHAVIVEIKTVEIILPVHRAQLMTYLRLTRCRLGLLINFFVPLISRGIVRMVN